MKETVRVLEKNQELTPAVLEHHLTESIGKLTTQVDDVEKSVMTMLLLVTAVSEQHLKLSSWQSTLEQLIIQHFGRKVRTDAKIYATGNIGTKVTMDISTNTNCLPMSLPQAQKTGQVQGSNSLGPILLALNPVIATRARSASPHPICSRKSPQLLEKEVSAALPSSKSPAL